MISRVRDGGGFLGLVRVGVWEVRGAGVRRGNADDVGVLICRVPETELGAEASISGVSDDEGSLESVLCFNGVRKGDLNGLRSVVEASFNRRRFACGVDIVAKVLALAKRVQNDRGIAIWVKCKLRV